MAQILFSVTWVLNTSMEALPWLSYCVLLHGCWSLLWRLYIGSDTVFCYVVADHFYKGFTLTQILFSATWVLITFMEALHWLRHCFLLRGCWSILWRLYIGSDTVFGYAGADQFYKGFTLTQILFSATRVLITFMEALHWLRYCFLLHGCWSLLWRLYIDSDTVFFYAGADHFYGGFTLTQILFSATRVLITFMEALHWLRYCFLLHGCWSLLWRLYIDSDTVFCYAGADHFYVGFTLAQIHPCKRKQYLSQCKASIKVISTHVTENSVWVNVKPP